MFIVAGERATSHCEVCMTFVILQKIRKCPVFIFYRLLEIVFFCNFTTKKERVYGSIKEK